MKWYNSIIGGHFKSPRNRKNMDKKDYHKQWREKNKEKIKQYNLKYKENSQGKIKKYHKEWYQKNKEKKLAQGREWAKNPENKKKQVRYVQNYVKRNKEKVFKYNSEYGKSLAGFWRRYKYRAKKAGYEITITLQDFQNITNEPCKYCGENDRQRGIDRVDNNKGYIIENCVSCCGKCNMMKMKQTKEEFLQHIKKIYVFNNCNNSPK